MPEPTPKKDKDKPKWLIASHGGAILRISGVTDLDRWQTAQTDLVSDTLCWRRQFRSC